MSRCLKLELISSAKNDFEAAPPEEQAKYRAVLVELLKAAIAAQQRTDLTPGRLEGSLRDVYRDCVRARKLEERQRLSRLR